MPKWYHFSVDDVLDSLLTLTESTRSPNACWLIDYFRELHLDYGANVDLYAFLQKAEGERLNRQNQGALSLPALESLCDLPATLAPLFKQLPWLRLGPHALDRDTPPHSQSVEQQASFLTQTYRQIARFAGPQCVSPWVRLHFFSECYEQSALLKQYGTRGLFTTDKPAISYRLPAPELEQLRIHGHTNYNGLEFIRSHVRVENLADRVLTDRALHAELDTAVGDAACAIIFTHEYELDRPEVREMTKRVFRWMDQNDLKPIFGA